jgi:hypothetical protein
VSSTDKQSLFWRRSSLCANGECVEVAYRGDIVLVRNSGASDIILEVGPAHWEQFITNIVTRRHSSLGLRGSDEYTE